MTGYAWYVATNDNYMLLEPDAEGRLDLTQHLRAAESVSIYCSLAIYSRFEGELACWLQLSVPGQARWNGTPVVGSPAQRLPLHSGDNRLEITLEPSDAPGLVFRPESTGSELVIYPPVTEERHPGTDHLDLLSPLQLAQLLNAEDACVAPAVAAVLPAIAAAIEGIADRLAAGGRLIYVGAGTSGRLGVLDAAECPPTFGVRPDLVQSILAGGAAAFARSSEAAEDSWDDGAEALARLEPSQLDSVVGLAASGRTPFVLGAMERARQAGVLTIGVTTNPGSPLARWSQLPIVPVVGPEALTGSTRLKSGTAQKMVLNLLSTGSMIRLGKVFGNLMVDLRATNAKLRERAVRMVVALTGVSRQRAEETLAAADQEAVTAVVMLLGNTSTAVARETLSASGHSLRRAIARLTASCPGGESR
ncbi:MAG: N-acetylmuramic acid 6-phosphate etherase [Bacillota bacterium]